VHVCSKHSQTPQTSSEPRYFDENAQDNKAQHVNEAARSEREHHNSGSSDFLFAKDDGSSSSDSSSSNSSSDVSSSNSSAAVSKRTEPAAQHAQQPKDDVERLKRLATHQLPDHTSDSGGSSGSGARYADENAQDNAAHHKNEEPRSVREHAGDSSSSNSSSSEFLFAKEGSSTGSGSGSKAKDSSKDKLEHAKQETKEVKDTVKSETAELANSTELKAQQAQQSAASKAAAAKRTAEEKASKAKQTAEQKAGDVKETAESKGEETADKAKSVLGRAKDCVGETASSVKHAAEDIKDSTKDKVTNWNCLSILASLMSCSAQATGAAKRMTFYAHRLWCCTGLCVNICRQVVTMCSCASGSYWCVMTHSCTNTYRNCMLACAALLLAHRLQM
jgi:gas vesicle protein